MTPDEIIVTALPGDVRVAWLRDGRLVRLAFDDGKQGIRAGDVYLGRVTKVDKSLGAAFVDIGGERDGFLMIGSRGGHGGQGKLSEGQAAIVQVARAPDGRKGAKLTRRPKLIGAFLAFVPFVSGIDGVTRAGDAKIDGALLELAKKCLPPEMGWTLRTRATAADGTELRRDAGDLMGRWRAIEAAAAQDNRAPRRLEAAADDATALIRDGLTSRLASVYVDDTKTLMRLRSTFASEADKFKAYRGATPVFAAFAIDAQIEAACGRHVALPSGGSLTIAETEALIAIDVDAGATQGSDGETTALTTNLEAAEALAHEIGLRDLAGHMVIDFVPMRGKGPRAKVLRALREALEDDDRQVDVAGYTRLGLVELTRERLGPTLHQRLTAACPNCAGEGRVAAPMFAAGDALRQVMAEARQTPGRRCEIIADPDLAGTLKRDMAAAIEACETLLGYTIDVHGDASVPSGRFRVRTKSAGGEKA